MNTPAPRAANSQLESSTPSQKPTSLSATAALALAALTLAWLIAHLHSPDLVQLPTIPLPKAILPALRRPIAAAAAATMTPTAVDAAASSAPAGSVRPPRKASFQPRRWHERGSADHGWLKTFHTFSFASYYDPRNMDFGPLRVLNEDRVAPKEGFPRHSHNNAEIFSYILSGELTHRDSVGNVEILKRGEVQFTSAGKGISHSEYNDHASLPVHFLQIWYTPDERNLQPKYYTLPQVPDEDKRDTLFPLIRSYKTFTEDELKLTGLLPQGRAIPAHADLTTSTSILSPGKSVMHHVGKGTDLDEGTERWIYVHVAMTNVGWKDPKDQQRALAAKLADRQSLTTKATHAKGFLGALYGWAPKAWGEAAPALDKDVAPGRPLVTLTFAQSLDGMIAGKGGKQLQLSGDESMIMTHAMRMMHDGILVGAGTLLNDDPQLNARHLASDIPVDSLPRPIVLDSKLRTPISAKLLKNAAAGTGRRPLIVTLQGADADKKKALEGAGAEVIELGASAKDAQGHLAWPEVLKALDTAGIKRLMVEGGAAVIGSLLRAHAEAKGEGQGLIDHLIATVARKQVGSDGTSYSAPAWVAKTLLPGRGKDLNPLASVTGGKELDQVTLTPEPFGKDLVLAWSHDAGAAARVSSLAVPSSSKPQASALIRVQGSQGGLLEEGDGVYIRGTRVGETLQFENVGEQDAEFLVFDVEPAKL